MFFIPDKIRALLSYGITLLFCYPVIPSIARVWKARTSGFKLYLLYFAWCLITATYSLAPEYSIARLLRALLLFAAATTCSLRAREAGQIQRLLRSMMLACITVTLLAAASAVVLPRSLTWSVDQNALPDSDDADIARFIGPFDNPSRLGELALVTIGLILTYFELAPTRQRIALAAAALMAAGLTAMADSRSGLVALATGSSIYICWRYRLKGCLALAAAGVLL